MKLRRLFYIGGSFFLFLTVFILDIVDKNVQIELPGLGFIRQLMILVAILLTVPFLRGLLSSSLDPVKKFGILLISSTLGLILSIGIALTGSAGFDSKGYDLIPLGYDAIILATVLSVGFGIASVVGLLLLQELVLYKRRKGSPRVFFIFLALVGATGVSTLFKEPLEQSLLTSVLFGLAVAFALVNAFRLSWIVYLTKREKLFVLLYGFFLVGVLIALNVFLSTGIVQRSLLYFSNALYETVQLAMIFGALYCGMSFISTLFHLPTAEVFDRKTSEMSSLHTLSKLITQILDFDELVDTVTAMTLQVVEAQSCWLEVVHSEGDNRSYMVDVVSMKNISKEEIGRFIPLSYSSIRDTVIRERRSLVIDELKSDPRFAKDLVNALGIGSLVVVPLTSHAGLIGILYATKQMAFGFFKDDIDLISTFADQATIAIDNSRLLSTSLEKERLHRELLLAQEMQQRLLPQVLPHYASLEVDAVSIPAFEVGGDYYDFVKVDEQTLGIVVGDVSGKGVSAAFYMSEMKGIFQALSRMYPSPREFMVKANEALSNSMDRHSFISLIYATLDVRSGKLTLARAGHCPMLLVSDSNVEYIRPTGMGMGLTNERIFVDSMEEREIQLQPGDVCVLYTDGVTEARKGSEEFGYERLVEATVQSKENSAAGIKAAIVHTMRTFTDQQSTHDDYTLVVLKWTGNGRSTNSSGA